MNSNKHLYMPEDHMEALYSSTNPLVKYVFSQRLDAIASRLASETRASILDSGCGEGHLLERLHIQNSNLKLTGVDVTKIALEKARTRCPYANFIESDITSLPFEDNTFDYVITTEVLEHIFKYGDVITEMVRVTKPGGSIIITFPHENLWTIARFLLGRRPIKVPDHVNAFSPSSMSRAVGLPKIHQESLPFKHLPFFFSLGCLLEYKK